MYAKKSVSMKVVVLLLAVVLLIGCVAGGTLAYLMAKSSAVTNTFVVGQIGTLTLNETDGNGQTVTERTFTVIPGTTITKDPVVTFNGNNVAAYVFLQVGADGWNMTKTAQGETSTYTYSIGADVTNGENTIEKEMKWVLAAGWKEVPNQTNVYYREVVVDTDVNTTATTEQYKVILNDTITVEDGITKDELGTNSSYAKNLTFTAYAIQQDGFNSVEAAWAQAKNATN